jgi:hypothetical protein
VNKFFCYLNNILFMLLRHVLLVGNELFFIKLSIVYKFYLGSYNETCIFASNRILLKDLVILLPGRDAPTFKQ